MSHPRFTHSLPSLHSLAVASLLALTARVAAADCAPDTTALCLANGRLRVAVTWDGAVLPQARPLGDSAGEFSPDGGRTWLVVRAVDGRAVNGHLWLLQWAPPNLAYRLTLEDLQTGATQTWVQRLGAPAESDLQALREGFPESGSAAARFDPEARQMVASEDGTTLDAEPVDSLTTVFRRAGSREPALVTSLLDGREVNGHWWLLAAAPDGGRFEIELPSADEPAATLFLASDGPATRLFDHAAPAHARGLKVTLDSARTTQASIGAAGGTLQATAANGARFTLTIPAQALAFPETITLTPIKSIAGLPFTPGLAAGVEIGPSGLRFGSLASLTIQPKQPVALSAETTFGYRLGGSLFFLYPAALGQRPVRLDILHTGGYGLAAGKASEQTAQIKKTPARLEDQFDQGLWQVHWQLRQSQASRTSFTSAPGEDLGHFQDYWDDTASKWVDAVAASCAGRKKYANTLKAFVAKATDDGLAGELATEFGRIQPALNQGAARCYADAVQACNAGDHKQPVPALQWWHELEAGRGTSLVSSAPLATCLTFQLEWKTIFNHSNPAPEGYTIRAGHSIDTKTMIHFHAPFDFGSAAPTPNDYIDATYTGGAPKPCTKMMATGSLQADVFSVPEMILDVNLYEDDPPPLKIELTYTTGNPQMQLQAKGCGPQGADGTPFYAALFAPAYLAIHFFIWHDAAMPPVGYTYEPRVDWNVTYGSNPWASLSFQGAGLSAPPLTASEDTDLKLFHKPGGT